MKTLNKKIIVLFLILFFSSVMNAVKLSSIENIKKLNNYNELKDIETENIEKYENRKEINGLMYINNEKYTGMTIERYGNGNISSIIFHKNGYVTGEKYEYYSNNNLKIKVNYSEGKRNGKATSYYSNGKLESNRYYKDNIMQLSTEYRQDGTIFRTYKAIDGLNGIRTVYYENGKDIKSVIEVTQDYSQKKMINYRLNGKLKAYDKQGRLKAILNFKNDSIAGLPQEMYYPNGKLKYYAIAKDNNQKNPSFTEKAISYYDNGQEKENCDEVDRGVWMCKKYDKNGKFKGEAQKGGQPIETSNFWANFFMGVLNILLQ